MYSLSHVGTVWVWYVSYTPLVMVIVEFLLSVAGREIFPLGITNILAFLMCQYYLL